MRDSDCVDFLQWALPRMGFRWPGYRKVRGQVCKRIGRRLGELGLEGLDEYRRYLREIPDEWSRLDGLCRITISRFCRDREVFRQIVTEVVPSLVRAAQAAGSPTVEVWSAGCGAGEEPYSLKILTQVRDEAESSRNWLRILATDSDSHQIHRARTAIYPASSLRELSPRLIRRAFELVETNRYRLRDEYRSGIEFRQQDLRQRGPAGPFQLILCRNLAFTYFDISGQQQLLDCLLDRLAAGGYLVIGTHEQLPSKDRAPSPLPGSAGVFGPSV